MLQILTLQQRKQPRFRGFLIPVYYISFFMKIALKTGLRCPVVPCHLCGTNSDSYETHTQPDRGLS